MKAFEGIRILDLTHVLAGPFTTYQLAVLGADVIKIESVDATDMNREIGAVRAFNEQRMGSHFQSQAANKRAIRLNLKDPEGRAVFLKLAESADVIVENYRAGVMDRLGLGYDDIRAVRPDIVYCSVTGFGQTGPKRAHAAFDNVIQAYSGMMLQTGAAEEEAVLVGPPVLDYGTGAQAAMAIAAALFRRERTGEGQYIDISMLDAALMLMTSAVLNVNTTGAVPGRSRYARAPFAAYGGYKTADGEVLMVGAATPAQHEKLWRALGRDDLADEVKTMRTCELPDLRDRDEAILTEILATRTADDWETHLNEAGLPAARVRTLNEALASEQVKSRALVGQVPSRVSKHGHLQPAVAAYACNADGPEVTSEPPGYGQHTREVLTELGYTETDIAILLQRGAIAEEELPAQAAE
jgi:crotonobetainyl-CoA:carnitine CoA-transferase CaiB-like acyl-CoA transferase